MNKENIREKILVKFDKNTLTMLVNDFENIEEFLDFFDIIDNQENRKIVQEILKDYNLSFDENIDISLNLFYEDFKYMINNYLSDENKKILKKIKENFNIKNLKKEELEDLKEKLLKEDYLLLNEIKDKEEINNNLINKINESLMECFLVLESLDALKYFINEE